MDNNNEKISSPPLPKPKVYAWGLGFQLQPDREYFVEVRCNLQRINASKWT